MVLRSFTTIFLILLFTTNSFGRVPPPTKAERWYKRHHPNWREEMKAKGGYGVDSEVRALVNGNTKEAAAQRLARAAAIAIMMGNEDFGAWPRHPTGHYMSSGAVYQKYGYGTPPQYTGPRINSNGGEYRPIRVGDHIEYQRIK